MYSRDEVYDWVVRVDPYLTSVNYKGLQAWPRVLPDGVRSCLALSTFDEIETDGNALVVHDKPNTVDVAVAACSTYRRAKQILKIWRCQGAKRQPLSLRTALVG